MECTGLGDGGVTAGAAACCWRSEAFSFVYCVLSNLKVTPVTLINNGIKQ
jgi:hypothetical protein